MTTDRNNGRVYLVGAGPGDPGLITLAGVECLQKADVVLHDYLANPRLLEHAPPHATFICLGRHGHGKLWTQDEINGALVTYAREGKTVVRLKGGDPAVFARGAQEAEVLSREGIVFQIVPGITAALAASSFAGIPITHRDMASAVALITGQERAGKKGPLDFDSLARFPGTLVFYMGVTTAEHWVAALIDAGKPADTPAAIVRRCSLPDQTTINCELRDVADRLQSERLRPPAIVIVGPVVSLATDLSWFEDRPLFGRRIVVTRPAHQGAALRQPLEELGADVIVEPVIEVLSPADSQAVDAALKNLADFDWLVFSSANGVRFTLERLFELGFDLRQLGSVRLAAVGPSTERELQRYRLRCDLLPDVYDGEALAAKLAPEAGGKKILLPRASRGRDVLPRNLAAAGADVHEVVVYESRDSPNLSPSVQERLQANEVDWVTLTSPAIARSVARLFGDHLQQIKTASISPLTSAALRELGYTPTTEAQEYTMAGVIAAIVEEERH